MAEKKQNPFGPEFAKRQERFERYDEKRRENILRDLDRRKNPVPSGVLGDDYFPTPSQEIANFFDEIGEDK